MGSSTRVVVVAVAITVMATFYSLSELHSMSAKHTEQEKRMLVGQETTTISNQGKIGRTVIPDFYYLHCYMVRSSFPTRQRTTKRITLHVAGCELISTGSQQTSNTGLSANTGGAASTTAATTASQGTGLSTGGTTSTSVATTGTTTTPSTASAGNASKGKHKCYSYEHTE